jgi:nuclear distribution protein NudE
MDNLRSERDKTLIALRDLEMGNDELERNERCSWTTLQTGMRLTRRVAVSSLLDLESKYNRAIEEKTLLEQEVIQRQELEEECQRLKDDIRGVSSGHANYTTAHTRRQYRDWHIARSADADCTHPSFVHLR